VRNRALTFAVEEAYRGMLMALLAWPLLYMAVNAMRTSAPGLAAGMAFLTVLPGALLAQRQRFER